METKYPIISIIVPVYNVEKYIRRCIQSIINQTYKDIEIILVNDGSTDMSKSICDEYKKKDSRIILINKENGGLSDARNAGIRKARGKYLAFVDSDDFIHEKMLEKMYDRIIYDDSDMAVCGYIEYFEEKTEKNRKYVYGKNGIITAEQYFESILNDENIGNYAWNKLYKKKLFDNVFFPKGQAFEDINTTYKLVLLSNKISVVNEALYYYQQRDNSISNLVNINHLRDQISAIIERNQIISTYYPNMQINCKQNELKFCIINFNQIAKKYRFGFEELIWYRNKIIGLRRNFNPKDLKYRISCFAIIRIPLLYSMLIFFNTHIRAN